MTWEIGSGLSIGAILLVVIVTAAMLIWVERRSARFLARSFGSESSRAFRPSAGGSRHD